MSNNRGEMNFKRQKHGLTVGTTVVPNLANRGNAVGKSIPLSQTVAPPAMDPDSGFTSVRMGTVSLSIFDEDVAWRRGIISLSDLGLEHVLHCSGTKDG